MDLDKLPLKSMSRSKLINIMLIVIIIILALYYGYRQNVINNLDFTKVKTVTQPTKQATPVPKKVMVADIEGSVVRPGIYEIEEGKRINDLLLLSGGFTGDVDADWVDINLNKAQKITDGMKLYIPSINKTAEQPVINTLPTPEPSASININTCTQAQLEALPGIGEVTAKAVIAARPYSDLNELTSKKILSKSVFEKIKTQLAI